MPAKNPDLHGNVPDKAPAALVLILEADTRPSEEIDLEELKKPPAGG